MKKKNSSQSKMGQGLRMRSVPLQNVQQPRSWQSGASCSLWKVEKSIDDEETLAGHFRGGAGCRKVGVARSNCARVILIWTKPRPLLK